MRLDLYECAVSARTSWLFVSAMTPGGDIGYGECSDGGRPAEVATVLTAALAHFAGLDLDVVGPDEVRQAATTAIGTQADLGRCTAIGGLEQAICDLAARRAGVPLWKWLGGTQRTHIPLYANINRVPGPRSPADAAASARAAVDAGFSAVKCAPFDEPIAGQPLVDAGVRRVAGIRREVGADVTVMVDCHERLATAEVAEVLGPLGALGVTWLEDATDGANLHGLRAIRRAAPNMVLAGGECAHDPSEVAPAVNGGLLDVVMPDVKHAGGILRAAQIAAAGASVQVSPHNPTGPIGTAASAHLFAALPNASVLEYAFGEAPWRHELVGSGEVIDTGQLCLPDGPGLGLDLITKHPRLRHVWSIKP